MSRAGEPPSYPEVPAQGRYPEIEERILAFWESDGTFQASIDQRKDSPELVFYDGPPFANGLPHYGHLLTGFVKDAMPRYHTMRGRLVERRFGWDCHGLPAETGSEKELGVSGRASIIEYGIDRFNEHCRTSVLRYTKAWERYVTRQGRWVDFENDYKTMDRSFMESVLWAFKALYQRGLVYEGYKVLPYCWECETPLSNFETRQDDAYRERTDPGITVGFDVLADPSAPPLVAGPLRLLAWTTTPWTLPSNLALAVHPDLDYALVDLDGRRQVIAVGRRDAYEEELGAGELVGTVKGVDLLGRRYRPIFPCFAELAESTESAFSVLAGDFVTTEEGTGIVQMAPGFGEDDQRVCEAHGIPTVVPVDSRGRFEEPVEDYAGMQVLEANPRIVDRLRELGVLTRFEEIRHSYPHCWRTDTPLIYRAVSSYFVEVSALKDRMVELNREISWVPAHVRDGAFGNWIGGSPDWPVSRNRFWGTPIPVWKSDDPRYPRVDVYGSLDELEADFGVRPSDLHRPAVDQLTRPNPDDPTGRSTMRRTEEVLDCWFDSGSMPFAQLHYPFEEAERFEANFPAGFICEYVGQTRGWFYTLHVLATALFDRPAFSTCLAHGILLGDDGRKLSKRLRNYPDPEEFFASTGADAMRWYLLSSPVLRGQDVIIEEKAMGEPVRQVLNPIWNCWHFLALYGRADHVVGRVRANQSGLLDRYILAKTRVLVEETTAALDRYDLAGACQVVVAFLEVLTNWYVRRSRQRFWRPAAEAERHGKSEDLDEDKRAAYDTLHTVLEVLCRLVAPLAPFLAEEVWQGLTGGRSVHLSDWPDPEELPGDPDLVAAMDLARSVASAAHSLRKEHGVMVRIPLRTMTVAAADAERLRPYEGLLREEANVKQIVLSADLDAHTASVLTVVPAALGPRLGPTTQQVIAAVKRGDWAEQGGRVVAGGTELRDGEYRLALRPLDGAGRVLPDDAGVVVLDLELDEELSVEGIVRGLVRMVQKARRDADLQVSDRIRLGLRMDPGGLARLEAWRGPLGADAPGTWRQEIAREVLATEIEVQPLQGELETGRSGGEASRSFVEELELAEIGTVVVRLVRQDPVGRS